MSGLSTHILDLTSGQPACGVTVRLFRLGEAGVALASCATNGDGRARLAEAGRLATGGYRIEFNMLDATRHHHVPLLVSPFGYSTYRGS